MAGGVSDYFGGIIPGTTGQLDPTSTRHPAGSAGIVLGTGTGQHGVIPLVSNIGGGVTSAISDFLDWVNTPFKTPMSPGSVGILVGVIIIAIVGWNFILYHVRIAAEAI